MQATCNACTAVSQLLDDDAVSDVTNKTIFKSADTSLLQIRAKDTLERCYSAGALDALESPKKEDRSSGSRGWQSREQQRVRLRQWWRYGQDKVLTKMYFFMRDGQPRLPALLSSCTLRKNCRPGGRCEGVWRCSERTLGS